MSTPTSIAQIDLTPPPKRTYFQSEREWREEFIYFLLVDRFHDDQQRACPPKPGRSAGVAVPDDFYGGTIRGITRNLDYIAGLGCTAIWLSPVFENNPAAYHDLVGPKDFANDDDQPGSELINTLIQAHSYWIREADVDGFRVDAVKHMGELACSRFSSGVREYAYSLGKRGFFLFGEVATPDDKIIDRYIG